MSLRKNRIACQGLNNLSQIDLITNKSAPFLKLTNKTATSSINLSKTKTPKHKLSKYDNPNMQMTTGHNFTASMGTRTDEDWHVQKNDTHTIPNETKKRLTLLCTKQSKSKASQELDKQNPKAPQKVQAALQQIRQLYKRNANVRKIIKEWGFESNGSISDQQFQHMICKHFDASITKEDCQELLKNYSGDKQNLDLMSFIKVIFDGEPFTKPMINVLDPSMKTAGKEDELSGTLVKRIHNLNEGGLLKQMDANKSCVSGLQQQKNKPRESVLKMAASQSISKLTSFDKTQPSLHQTLWSESNPRYTFQATKSHGVEFTPTQFYGINQQKTRFGATPAIELNNQCLPENKRAKIVDEKMKVMEELQKGREMEKCRFENKLSQIREHKEKEKENIRLIEQKAEERDMGNMKKLREETLAYNYVNFIHNDWK